MDGINRYSLNIKNDKSSSALTDEAKQIALKEQQLMIKNVDESEKKKAIKRKTFEENENEEKLIISYEYTDDDGKQNEGSYNKDSEFYNTELDKIYGEYDKDDLQIHLNDDGKTVEIVDIINNKIVATIDIENLSDIIKRLKIPTSMLVNKRV
ncbi:MAG: hypothetical protein BHW64_04490 [Candidatus Melainabacteria bacterium LEY3_CP_29_8]|nr:MAG: hypothetical protein BHW64_04490 [Candidatus Melainabacteria bacterium LEY3_CP_29_8]